MYREIQAFYKKRTIIDEESYYAPSTIQKNNQVVATLKGKSMSPNSKTKRINQQQTLMVKKID